MSEISIPCLVDPNKSCLRVDLELRPPETGDAETIAGLTEKHGLTNPQAEFCADCSRGLFSLIEAKQA
jgi:hypothetical protein